MIHVIINPAGAGGAAKQTWAKVRDCLKAKGVPFKAHFSSPERDIDALTRGVCRMYEKQHALGDEAPEAWADDVLTLLVIGGDGTMNLLVNGITDFDRVNVGFIPCGSGNDLARSIGITKDAGKELETILKGEVRRHLDIGDLVYLDRYNEKNEPLSPGEKHRYFNISCGVGFDAAVCWKVQTTPVKSLFNKLHLGKLSYIAIATQTIFKTPKVPMTLVFEDHEVTFPKAMFAAFMNEPYQGGGFKFAPEADPTDEIYDVCVADGLSTLDFFRVFPSAYSGGHVNFKGITMHRGHSVEVKADIPMWIHTDGEVECMSKHVRLQFRAEKLRLLN